MQYKFKNEQDKIQFARQMADYISKNKFKQQNTDEALYADILKSLKNSKDVNLQGMDGFQYKPVNKKASYNMLIQKETMQLLKQAAENSWWSNTKNFFNNLNPFKGSPDTEAQFKLPEANNWLSRPTLGMSGVLGAGGGMMGAINLSNRLKTRRNNARFNGGARYLGGIMRDMQSGRGF